MQLYVEAAKQFLFCDHNFCVCANEYDFILNFLISISMFLHVFVYICHNQNVKKERKKKKIPITSAFVLSIEEEMVMRKCE